MSSPQVVARLERHPTLRRLLARCRFDPAPAHRPPRIGATVVATVASVGLCLAADAAVVAIGTAVFPATTGYQHFHFGDYATLTVLGVVVACLGWPIVVRLSSAPRWIFSRLAVAVSAVLLLPDLAIWLQGQPGRAVAVLAVMHLAIAVVTYNVVVRVAPPRDRSPSDAGAAIAA